MATDGMHDTGRAGGIAAEEELARLSRLMAAPSPWGAPSTSGFRGIDRLLPAGGICRGSLVEWIGGPASGAAALAFAVACRLVAARHAEAGGRLPANGRRGGQRAAGGTIVVVDRRGRFHPPAVFPWIEMAQGGSVSSSPRATRDGPCGALVVVRPARDEDEIWAIDQALRCPGVTAVVAWPERATSTALRRWQVGARAGGAVGLLVRPVRARREPSWAQARFDVAALCSIEGAFHPWAAGGGERAATPAGGERAATPAGGGERAAAPAVRLVPSLGVRRLRVTLLEGPWACAGPPDARGVEVALDLSNGREAFASGRETSAEGRVVRGDRTGADGAAVVPETARVVRTDRFPRPDGRPLPGGMQCRAS